MKKTVKEILHILHNSSDERKIRWAKTGLSVLLSQESEENLMKRIRTSKDNIEIRESKWQLWLKNVDKTFNGLMNVIKKSKNSKKISQAAIMLGEQGYADAVKPIIQLLTTTNNYKIRNGAAIGLRELKDQRAFLPLIKQIKKHPESCEILVYALEFLDCSSEVELLVDLFISQPKALLLRLNIKSCFEGGAVKKIRPEIIKRCYGKIEKAMSKSKDEHNTRQLRDLYEMIKNFERKRIETRI